MWRCYRCETFNNQDYCFICGLPKAARLPVKEPPKKRFKGASPATENVFRFGAGDNEPLETEKTKASVSPILIVAVILIVLLFIWYVSSGI